MNRSSLGVFSILICSWPLGAQEGRAINFAGVSLIPGMSEDRVMNQLEARTDLRVSKPQAVDRAQGDRRDFVVEQKRTGGQYDSLGVLVFKEHQLVQVSKIWELSKDPNLVAFVENLFSLISNSQGEGMKLTTLRAWTTRDLGSEEKRISFHAGDKMVDILATRGRSTRVQVTETTGLTKEEFEPNLR